MDALTPVPQSNEQPRIDDVYVYDKEIIRRMSEDTSRGCWLDASPQNEEIHALQRRSPRSTNLLRRRSQPRTQARRNTWVPSVYWVFLVMASFLITPTTAVRIPFTNCLPISTQSSGVLQFVPKFVDAVFNTTDQLHNLRLTIWGNVTGAIYQQFVPPAANDSYWSDPTKTDGKILDVTASTNILTALRGHIDFLSYEPYNENVRFCTQLINSTCPLSPSFASNPDVVGSYPSFSANHDFESSYAFTSLTSTFQIINGDEAATSLGCISASVTPDLGQGLSSVLKFMPLLVLLLAGAATAFASVYSPWGTTDIFRWTSNYGRDDDLLRLVTPGFGDCLQYIQFIALTGGLTLSYPGYYQPVTSKVAWSVLMFNESFVSHGNGTQSLVDGIYVTSGVYGLENMSQLVGMTDVDDIWAGMAVWLLVVLGALMTLVQLGFLCRWIHRKISGTHEEDLRAKNMPFSVGNVIRIVFSYFLLPIVTFSMFQFVIASKSPAYTVALAVVLLLAVLGFAIWLLYVVISTRPRSFLFDDLPTVLLYGPLYNTYSDNAAAFALVPVILTFIRGVAIGAVQPSGVAQLVLLAICEVITILTLHSFRPFHSPTSMNAYHTFFAACRFTTILLMVAFTPSLGVTDGPKGWIGYAILLLHAIVLVFAFLLNAIQTIVEVAARLAGAGGDESGAARGGFSKVFGMRQLSRRLPRDNAGSRQSQLSSSVMLDSDKSGAVNDGRMRSQSAGSNGILLARPRSMGLDSIDPSGGTPTTPGDASMFSFLPSAAAPSASSKNRGTLLNLSTTEAPDPYYRPPRYRRPTMDVAASPAARSRGSWTSGDWANKGSSQQGGTPIEGPDPLGPSVSGRASPVGGVLAGESQAPVNEPRRSQTDYTTREVDFYYGVRGPALNANVPGRRLRTGPVDPTNNISSIGGFFKGLLGGKTKEKGKGFEVVRSSRMPPGMKARNVAGDESPPEGIPIAAGVARNGPIDSDDEDPVTAPSASQPMAPTINRENSENDSEVEGDDEEFEMTRISDVPPSLPGIDTGDGFAVPSRIGSKASTKPVRHGSGPTVPRKSSRRISEKISLSSADAQELAMDYAASSAGGKGRHEPQPYHRPQNSTGSSRLPFDRSNSKRQSTISTRSSILPPTSDTLSERPTNVGHVHNHSVQTINPEHMHEVDLLGSSAEIVNSRDRRHSFDMD